MVELSGTSRNTALEAEAGGVMHTTFPRGKTLIVGLRGGGQVVGKYRRTDFKRKQMHLEVEGRSCVLPLRRIRFASIRRGRPRTDAV